MATEKGSLEELCVDETRSLVGVLRPGFSLPLSTSYHASAYDVLSQANAQWTSSDELSPDALGNLISQTTSTTFSALTTGGLLSGGQMDASTTTKASNYVATTGQLNQVIRDNGNRTDFYQYDKAGNTAVFTSKVVRSPSTSEFYEDRVSYYRSDGKVVAADWRTVPGGGQEAQTGELLTAFEEYYYDALGRRVLVRARRLCVDGDNPTGSIPAECDMSTVRRIVWDGDQELYEIQMPGGAGEADIENDTAFAVARNDGGLPSFDTNHFFGRVAYTNGLTTDQPLSIIRMKFRDQQHQTWGVANWEFFSIVPFWGSTGQAEDGAFADGSIQICKSDGTNNHCGQVEYPAGWFPYQRRNFVRTAWYGSQLEDKVDRVGTAYRRNREYDLTTGRFTQEDPIGLAGGLNLYGYAGGDPVNFTDPFGLCVKDDTVCEGLVKELRAQKGSEFQRAADRYEAADYRVHMVSATDSRLDPYGLNSDRDPESWVNGRTNTSTKDVYLRSDLSTGDQLVNATHEARHIAGFKHPRDDTAIYHADWKAFNQLPPSIRRGAVFESDLFYSLWGSSYGKPFVSRP